MIFLRKNTLSYVEAVGVTAAVLVVSLLVLHAWHVGRAYNVQLTAAQSLHGRQLFPPDDPWNSDISKEPVDPNSAALIASIGADSPLHADFGTTYRGTPLGIPYVLVGSDQAKLPIKFGNPSKSDAGPYPIPPTATIEGGPDSHGDRHVIVLDRDNWRLYELYEAWPDDSGKFWLAESGAIFDLSRNSVQRPHGFTSADAAGLPIFAGLARYDEVVQQGKLKHALRFTAPRTRAACVYPASHFASSNTDENLPPMGMRVRLKHDYDISKFPPPVRVILQGLKQYGMILADNGSSWYISGAHDPRWNNDQLRTLTKVRGSDFEVVRMGRIMTTLDSPK